MNTLICAGGTGTRVLESLLHLCAAGLGPEKLRLLVVDPDSSNGNGDRLKRLVELYTACFDRFAGKLGTGLRLFGTELDLLETGSRREGLKIWSPVEKGQRLRDILNVELLDSTSTPPELLKLLFSQEELEMDLSQGFRGHPAVGAAVMSLVALHKDEKPWRQLIEKVQGDLAAANGSRVVLAGSVFGGTGVSTFFPLARFLQEIAEGKSDRLHIAVTALTPYFRFESAAADASLSHAPAARSSMFPVATRSAVDFYDHLQSQKDWPFRSIFWMGDDQPTTVPYAPGGPEQRNPSHFVELLAALAAIEFFQQPTQFEDSMCASYGTDAESGNGRGRLGWKDLPLNRLQHDPVAKNLLRFLMVGGVHVGFTGPLVTSEELERRPYRVPWYWERFGSKSQNLFVDEEKAALSLLDDFFDHHHLPWWREVHQSQAVQLFNRAALGQDNGLRLDRLSNLWGADKSGEADLGMVDEFYTALAKVPAKRGGETGAAAYLSLLSHAADAFIEDRYSKKTRDEE